MSFLHWDDISMDFLIFSQRFLFHVLPLKTEN